MSVFFVVILKHCFVSIPKGAIMSFVSFAITCAAPKFQFQKVRL